MSKTKIEKLKKEFWKEYTPLWNAYTNAFELMRKIGVEQGKLKSEDKRR